MIAPPQCARTNGEICWRSTRKLRLMIRAHPRWHFTKTWRRFSVSGPSPSPTEALLSQACCICQPKVSTDRVKMRGILTCITLLMHISPSHHHQEDFKITIQKQMEVQTKTVMCITVSLSSCWGCFGFVRTDTQPLPSTCCLQSHRHSVCMLYLALTV